MAATSPAPLIAMAHRCALTLLSGASGRHHLGLCQGARDLGRWLTPRFRLRLPVLSDTAALAQHITAKSVDGMLLDVEHELSVPRARHSSTASTRDELYANDPWAVARGGGMATRKTTGSVVEPMSLASAGGGRGLVGPRSHASCVSVAFPQRAGWNAQRAHCEIRARA